MDRRTFIKVASALPLMPGIAMGSSPAVVKPIVESIRPLHLDLTLAKSLCNDAMQNPDDGIICLTLSQYKTASTNAIKYITQRPVDSVVFGLAHLSEEVAGMVGGMDAQYIHFYSIESVSVGAARALGSQGRRHHLTISGLARLDSCAAEHLVSAAKGNNLSIRGGRDFELHPDLARVLAGHDDWLTLKLGNSVLQAESARELVNHSGNVLELYTAPNLSNDVLCHLQSNPMKACRRVILSDERNGERWRFWIERNWFHT